MFNTSDFIIIGGGSAGSILANKLSKNPKNKVLLIEAGGPDTRPEIYVPAAWASLLQTEMEWNYWTVPQAGLNGRRDAVPLAKILGGCSSHNAMIYIRGDRAVYDEWEKMGNKGWGYDSLLPSFKEVENNERGADAFHGVGGGLNVTDLAEQDELVNAFVASAQEAGLESNKDFNGASQTGVGFFQFTQINGERCSASRAFLHPIMDRPNLTIETHAEVTKILFEGTKCVGVQYSKFGEVKEARASKEVILSAGAINSPRLLMVSGVGPAAQLAPMGIPIVADIPGVGQNLQEHPSSLIQYYVKKPASLSNLVTPQALGQWAEKRTGPFVRNAVEAGGFHYIDKTSIAPDLQFHFVSVLFRDHGLVPSSEHGYTLVTTLIMPKSRGSVSLYNADPFRSPLIDYNYYAEESDMNVMVEAFKLTRKIGSQPSFKDLNGGEVLSKDVRSDDEIRDYTRSVTQNTYHPVGTCKMGNDPMAVVDSNLKVRGIQGLRVCDASIMPLITNGNTNAPSIVIGTKSADLILADHA